jgi:DNA-binding transcriptional LysR family regulator
MRGLPDLTSMAFFIRIVEEGSISAAGRALGLPKATISRRLATLEKRIGAPLIARSTRAISLTDVGRRFYERISPIIREAEAAQSEMVDASAAPSGLLRVTASILYGQAVVAPKLLSFAQRYPDVRLDLRFSDERPNIVAEGFDLAIRMGDIEDSDLISRKLADIPMVIVAAPSYVDAHGAPRNAQDLKHHVAVLVRPNLDHWNVGTGVVRMRWRVSAGSLAVTREAVLAGLGLMRVPEFVVEHDLKSGALMRLLPDDPLPIAHATALYPRSKVSSRALRFLLDHLSKRPSSDNLAPR